MKLGLRSVGVLLLLVPASAFGRGNESTRSPSAHVATLQARTNVALPRGTSRLAPDDPLMARLARRGIGPETVAHYEAVQDAVGGPRWLFAKPDRVTVTDVTGKPFRLADVNPTGLVSGRYDGDPNCMKVVVALDHWLGGEPAVALPGAGSPAEWAAHGIDVTKFRGATREEIAARLLASGPGSRGIVWGIGPTGTHVWNVYNEGGRIRFLDGQKGMETSWARRFPGRIGFLQTH